MEGDLETIKEEIYKEMQTDCGQQLPGWAAGRHQALAHLLRWVDKRIKEKSRIKQVSLCAASNQDLAFVVNQLVDAMNELQSFGA